jgi:hypothetical protein
MILACVSIALSMAYAMPRICFGAAASGNRCKTAALSRMTFKGCLSSCETTAKARSRVDMAWVGAIMVCSLDGE